MMLQPHPNFSIITRSILSASLFYLMARLDELKPEDKGSYEGPLAKQKEECLRFLNKKLGGKIGAVLFEMQRSGIEVLSVTGK